jgi:hypothetical protein
MKKVWLALGVLIGIAFLGIAIYGIQLRKQTKALSPEAKTVYASDDLELAVFYSRPFKKGRKIFGDLVPYGELWRTGANEATVFATSKDILVDGRILKRGRYQVITVPYPDHWSIIINSDIPGWGINTENGKVYHNIKEDVLVFDAPVTKQTTFTEQFTISIDENPSLALSFLWDSTKVTVPLGRIE